MTSVTRSAVFLWKVLRNCKSCKRKKHASLGVLSLLIKDIFPNSWVNTVMSALVILLLLTRLFLIMHRCSKVHVYNPESCVQFRFFCCHSGSSHFYSIKDLSLTSKLDHLSALDSTHESSSIKYNNKQISLWLDLDSGDQVTDQAKVPALDDRTGSWCGLLQLYGIHLRFVHVSMLCESH